MTAALLLWLLLPIAALTGWWAARRDLQKRAAKPIPGHYLQGINYLLNEQPDKAMDLFVNAVDLDADTVETYIVIGNLMRRRGEVERAIRLHQNLIARRTWTTRPRRTRCWSWRATTSRPGCSTAPRTCCRDCWRPAPTSSKRGSTCARSTSRRRNGRRRSATPR